MLLLAPLLFGCNKAQVVDLHFTNGIFHTASGETADELAVFDGSVVELGEDYELGPATEEVDLDGQVAYPGFQDAHVHLLAGSFVLQRLVMLGAGSMTTILSLTADYVETMPADEPWVIGYGWLKDMGDDAELDGRLLDEIVSDKPALLVDNSGHSALVNSFALQLAGIDADTPDPDGGTIVRDPDTGEPTGYLLEEALSLVSELAMAEYDDTMLGAGLPDALADFRTGGLTGVSEIMASPGFDLARPWIYQDLEERGELDMRIHYYVPVFAAEDIDAVADYAGTYDGELVRFVGGKIWVDGSMGTEEAWMSEPLEGTTDNYGSPYFDVDELTYMVGRAEELGFPLKMHVNGDAAVSAALDALEAVASERGGLDQPHVLDHLVLVQPQDVDRMANLGITASVQPAHYLGARLGDTADAWGDERFGQAYDFSQFPDAGIELALGTDWPVWLTTAITVNAWAATNAAEGHALDIEQALTAYAEGSALAAGRSADLGKLQPGYLADIVVFPTEPVGMDPDDVSAMNVSQVWLGGRQVR